MVKYVTCGDIMFKIGNIVIKGNVVLAPMAGVCNSAFRKIIKEMGCPLVYAEMVSDKGLIFDSKKTKNMLYFEECERPIAQQIFGSDKDTFVEAAKMVEEIMHPDIIDINMGCPVPKVAVKSQAGSALLKNPNKIRDIVSAVAEAVNVPVTVKIRSGWDTNSINAVEVAKICEEAGAIMIGRGVLGNPWLMKEIITYLDTGKIIAKPSYEDKINMCFHHLDYLLKLKDERVAVLEMRSHAAWYLKGLPGAQSVKNEIFRTKTSEELKNILNNYLKELKNNV